MITFALMCNVMHFDWSDATCHNTAKGNESCSEIKIILFFGNQRESNLPVVYRNRDFSSAF